MTGMELGGAFRAYGGRRGMDRADPAASRRVGLRVWRRRERAAIHASMRTPSTTSAPAGSAARPAGLTVAVTGAGGTLGRLSRSARVGRIVALGRHEIETAYTEAKVDVRRVDVRDRDGVEEALAGADVVVHMAFSLYGVFQSEQELFATNVEGTANVARAAVAAGAQRFVYTSSAAVYGGRKDQSEPLAEDAQLQAGARLFYARHKAQAELVVRDLVAGSDTALYLFRPCAIVGPHAAGAAISLVPRPVIEGARQIAGSALRMGTLLPLPAPPVPLQFVHEDDVAQALELAVLGSGEPGVYNLAGEGALTGAEVLRLLGLRRLPVPDRIVAGGLRLLATAPPLIPAIGWPELIRQPLLVDTRRARRRLGWQPRFTSAQALAATRLALTG
jgi:nucleoside-diphosphate-sugar epimerase